MLIKSMKYLTQMLLLVAAVAVTSSMAMALDDTETFIVLQNNTDYDIGVGIKDEAGKDLPLKKAEPRKKDEKYKFPIKDFGEKKSAKITILDKNDKSTELDAWTLDFNPEKNYGEILRSDNIDSTFLISLEPIGTSTFGNKKYTNYTIDIKEYKWSDR